ncbi:hypothetical protein EDD21DRAFT_137154 [Dissophora ornata]|nr:hypothetical protein EDD21DRAFT_137154 [Dissophora ornata]
MGQTSSTPSSTSSSPPSSSSSARNRGGTDSSGLASQASQSPQSSPSTTMHIDNNTTHYIAGQTYPPPPQQQQQEQLQQPRSQHPPSSSRVLRSTTERRRRANLFSSFYPLLSRSSSDTNVNGGNAVLESNQGQDGPSSSSLHRPGPSPMLNTSIGDTSVSESSAGSSSSSSGGAERPPSRAGTAVAGSYGSITRPLSRSPTIQTSSSSSGGRTPRGLSRVQRFYDEQSVTSTRSSSRASSVVAAGPYINPSANVTPSQNVSVEDMDIDPESVGINPQEQQSASVQEQSSTLDQEQPSTSEQEQPLVTEQNPEEDVQMGQDARPESGADRSQLLLSQLPFVMRFLAEFSQGIRSGTEGSTEDSEGTQSNENLSNEDAEPGNAEAQSASANGSERTTESTTAAPSTETNARPRRHHTTIRFIQIGGGSGSGLRHRHGATAPASDQEGGEGEPRDDQTAHASEDVGEAVIMFLAGPATDSQSDSDSNESAEHEGLDDPESTRPRRRQRSPWVVLTLSGACKSQGGNLFDRVQ